MIPNTRAFINPCIKSIELKLSIVDIIYKIGLRSNLKVATIKPPKTPIMFPINTRNGTAIIDAKSLVDIRIALV